MELLERLLEDRLILISFAAAMLPLCIAMLLIMTRRVRGLIQARAVRREKKRAEREAARLEQEAIAAAQAAATAQRAQQAARANPVPAASHGRARPGSDPANTTPSAQPAPPPQEETSTAPPASQEGTTSPSGEVASGTVSDSGDSGGNASAAVQDLVLDVFQDDEADALFEALLADAEDIDINELVQLTQETAAQLYQRHQTA